MLDGLGQPGHARKLNSSIGPRHGGSSALQDMEGLRSCWIPSAVPYQVSTMDKHPHDVSKDGG